LKAAARQLESLGETVDRYILLRQMGDAYLALNLYAEAEDAYQRAQSGLAAAGLTLHLALSQWGLGAVLTARGRLVEAGEQMVAAGQLFDQLENRPLRSAVLLEESRLRELSGAAQQARTLAQSALDLVIGTNWTVQQIYAYLRNADLAYPDLARVESLLNQAQPLVDALQLPHFRYRLQGRWGRLRLRQGDGAAAQPLLESAISEIEQLRNTLVHERLRAAFLQDKTEVYQDLVQLHLDRGDVADIRTAFTVAEQAKSRALVDLIAGVVRTQRSTISGEQANVELLQQLDALQAELNAVYSELLGGPDDGSVRTAGSTILLARAAQLEQTISHLQLRRQIVEVAPDALHAGSTFAVAPPAVDSPRQVVYHILGEEVLAFLCRAGRIDTIRGLTTVTRVRELAGRLAAQWARFRIHPSFIQAHQRQLELTAQRLLHHLYCELLAPIIGLLDGESASAGVTPLVIVPHDLLHQLPFHAFYDGQQYLLERFAISYAPSATVFALCQQRQRRNTGPALALAAPDAQIPAAAQEVEQVASALRAAGLTVHTLVQQAATSAALRTLADHCRLLHLACHGLFRRDTPMFSALKLDDGWLTAGEMAQLDLHGALVTLSACESGRSQVIGGDELLGLTYAVLSAGAASLVVSQWLVQDGVTAELMAHWYQLLTQVDDLALALRTAQLAVMAQHSHPYYWAPFVVVGRRTNG
jgi:CHAT domain-containing protein